MLCQASPCGYCGPRSAQDWGRGKVGREEERDPGLKATQYQPLSPFTPSSPVCPVLPCPHSLFSIFTAWFLFRLPPLPLDSHLSLLLSTTLLYGAPEGSFYTQY